jgi:hypothetical protein
MIGRNHKGARDVKGVLTVIFNKEHLSNENEGEGGWAVVHP